MSAPMPLGVTQPPARPTSPYLTTLEAAEYARFTQPGRCAKYARKAFREWAQRQDLRPRRRGRVLLYDRRELEMVLDGRRWPWPQTASHARSVAGGRGGGRRNKSGEGFRERPAPARASSVDDADGVVAESDDDAEGRPHHD